MTFDITDAYDNIKELRKENDLLILRQEYLIEILEKDGMLNDKEMNKWIEAKYKGVDKDVK